MIPKNLRRPLYGFLSQELLVDESFLNESMKKSSEKSFK